MLKLVFRFCKYLYPPSNPLPGKRFMLFLAASLLLGVSLFSYCSRIIEERIEFLSFSPTPSMPGKLYSLAYFSAVSGDVTLGKYFYDLSLSYGMDEASNDDRLMRLIYPEKKILEENEYIDNQLSFFPNSRDLHILKALISYDLKNYESLNESVDELMKIDPNNPLVLGLEDLSR